MGTYTGLRFTAELSPLGVQAVEALLRARTTQEGCLSSWGHVAGLLDIPGLRGYLLFSRADFIPFGALSYMPDTWEQSCSLDGTTWEVCCSLKNYGGEIEYFLDEILPYLVASPCEAEILHEMWDNPETWTVEPREIERASEDPR